VLRKKWWKLKEESTQTFKKRVLDVMSPNFQIVYYGY
jgi:hypothetical protein